VTSMQSRVNLAGLDLNLLVALRALIEEQNVTRAGERVGLTQPAMSAALARLRRHFGDELMVRHGNRYELTPLGVALRHRTELAVVAVERVFAAQPDFDPTTSEREFTVLLSDYALMVLGPVVANLLEEEAHRGDAAQHRSVAAAARLHLRLPVRRPLSGYLGLRGCGRQLRGGRHRQCRSVA
jgi:hypothetical protein